MKNNQNLAQNLRCVKSLVDDGILELGLFYKPSSCALRIYLDTTWIEGSHGDPIARFSYSYGYASAVCKALLGEKYFVCILIESEDKKIPPKDIEGLKSCFIAIPKERVIWKTYSEDDALHRTYKFYEDTIGALPKYVWSSISQACSILPSCSATIFLANFKTSVLININRGMDILVSDADSALPLIYNSLTTVSKLYQSSHLKSPEIVRRDRGQFNVNRAIVFAPNDPLTTPPFEPYKGWGRQVGLHTCE